MDSVLLAGQVIFSYILLSSFIINLLLHIYLTFLMFLNRNSSIHEKGSSALLTVELDDQVTGMSKEVSTHKFSDTDAVLIDKFCLQIM